MDKDLVKALINEFEYWVSRHGCTCGHPACNSCSDTKEAEKLIETAKENL